jgi:hypothetical protein
MRYIVTCNIIINAFLTIVLLQGEKPQMGVHDLDVDFWLLLFPIALKIKQNTM